MRTKSLVHMCGLLVFSILSIGFVWDVGLANRGEYVDNDKFPFVVYIVSACAVQDDLCGGSIITTSKILTSASCLLRRKYLYVIAGYKKLVPEDEWLTDECFKNKKNRIVTKIVPTVFDLNDTSHYTVYNIGIAVVAQPYLKHDVSYLGFCDYIPGPVKINFNPRNDIINASVLTIGWGSDHTDELMGTFPKSPSMTAASALIAELSKCTKDDAFKTFNESSSEYVICVDGTKRGNVHQSGMLYYREGLHEGWRCDGDLYKSRRKYEECMKSPFYIVPETTTPSNLYDTPGRRVKRDSPVCKYDEGNPLVLWRARWPILIGVALPGAYKLESKILTCSDYALFASTAKQRVLVKCLLLAQNSSELKEVCKFDSNDITVIDTSYWDMAQL